MRFYVIFTLVLVGFAVTVVVAATIAVVSIWRRKRRR